MSEICAAVHRKLACLSRHRFSFDARSLPPSGVYVLFENGEISHGVDRIVRIGTHTGDGQLPSRLKQHFINENKDRSIFGKNIGRALLTRKSNPLFQQWEIDLTSRKAKDRYAVAVDSAAQQQMEQQVTRYMQSAFAFTIIPIEKKEQRLRLESALVSTVSRCEECGPSATWLGQFSPKLKIRESGLWQVNELRKESLTTVEWTELDSTLDRLLTANAGIRTDRDERADKRG